MASLSLPGRQEGTGDPPPTSHQEAHQGCSLPSSAPAFSVHQAGMSVAEDLWRPVKPRLRRITAPTAFGLRGPVIQPLIRPVRKMSSREQRGLTPTFTVRLGLENPRQDRVLSTTRKIKENHQHQTRVSSSPQGEGRAEASGGDLPRSFQLHEEAWASCQVAWQACRGSFYYSLDLWVGLEYFIRK